MLERAVLERAVLERAVLERAVQKQLLVSVCSLHRAAERSLCD